MTTPRGKATEEQKALMRQMFEAQATLQEVADATKFTISAVSRWRIKMGLAPQGYTSAKRRDLSDKVQHYWSELGWSQNRIAKELSLDRSTVGKWIEENNWLQEHREETPNPWVKDRPSNEELLRVWTETMQLTKNFKVKRGSPVRIAEHFKVSSSTAQRWLADAGISNDTHGEIVKIREEIVDLFKQGQSIQHIIEQTGVTKIFVSKILREAGHNIPTLMDERYEHIKDQLPGAWERSQRWNKNLRKMMGSAPRVGKEFGVSAATAQRWLVKAGVVEPRGATFDTQRVVELFEQGWSIPRIAVEVEVSENAVRKWLTAAGRDLSSPHSRMTHEEKIAFRRSVSEGKVASVAGSGRYDYNSVRLDSPQEVIFAKNCDRLGIQWRTWNRAVDGVLSVDTGKELPENYAPDFMVGTLPVEIKGIYDSLAATKVKAWRNQPGRPKLAMIMKQELFELEAASSVPEAMLTLEAACYLDPPAEKAFWNDY